MFRRVRPVQSVVVAVALCLIGACSSSSVDTSTTTTTVAATTTAAHSTSSTLALTPAGKTYGVGRRDITLVDTSRSTDGDDKNDVAPRKDRTLKTVVLYPTTDPAADATSDDHPVAAGRFPLFVFAHGVTASGPAYVPVLKQVAAAGFVVALPTFPLTSGPNGWDNLDQVVNQPGDVSFVIGEMLKRSAGTDDPLTEHLSPQAVAAGGHSLGAMTSMFFYNSCCRDDRLKAVVSMSGTTVSGESKTDTYDNPPDLPLLMLHGQKDPTVPYDGGSKRIFDTFTDVPRALVTFPDAGHTDLLGSASAMPSVIAFLNLELRDEPTAWEHLDATLAENGDATIEVAGGLPQPD